ncbi:hypothetical protein FPSE_06691 [Fusarium pseudograminearum CS3096]|uniref:Uncharacterized protein n=1 Tax=Fusarium pseudograminearum (strain CS3096) TaxID=1028729 RepID=K3VIS2_FUSPC|nr:hypothetical protein FPSE_06691 [Fusarium pseudograminearum CS3096]EKJ73078.1 hypothetical protein FPSE_06691 [Fusarium pseudograminearum CS3096]KAF0635731.1 hypothetical protein FPSE5266_06691 [Fusarium pseudograminearum]
MDHQLREPLPVPLPIVYSNKTVFRHSFLKWVIDEAFSGNPSSFNVIIEEPSEDWLTDNFIDEFVSGCQIVCIDKPKLYDIAAEHWDNDISVPFDYRRKKLFHDFFGPSDTPGPAVIILAYRWISNFDCPWYDQQGYAIESISN